MGHVSKILYILCTYIVDYILHIIYFISYTLYKGGGGVYGTRIDMDSTNNHLHNQLLCSCSSFDDINVMCELSYQEYSVSQNRL